jgi:hypothetical protein
MVKILERASVMMKTDDFGQNRFGISAEAGRRPRWEEAISSQQVAGFAPTSRSTRTRKRPSPLRRAPHIWSGDLLPILSVTGNPCLPALVDVAGSRGMVMRVPAHADGCG